MGSADFNDVMAIFQEFGPRRTIPVEQRWRERFPAASDQELHEWRERCQRIEAVALSRAEEVFTGRMTEDAAREDLSQQFPELNLDAIKGIFWQARYFAWKDGW